MAASNEEAAKGELKATGKIERLATINRRITRACLWAAASALMVMMLITVSNISGRSLFNLPVLGANEIVSLAGVVLISFVVGFVQFEHRNVITSILVDRLPPRTRAIFDTVTLFLASGIVFVMTWAGIAFGIEEIVIYHKVTMILGITVGPFKAVWGIGCIILFLVLTGHFIEALSRSLKR
jgi:TRAP-type C4-dicarboxylate transport system permease small subunit